MTDTSPAIRQIISALGPGLHEQAPGFWRVESELGVSYPESAHLALAEIEETSFWFNHRNAVIRQVIDNAPPSGVIVDIGGGNGYVSLALQRAGYDCLVVEPGQHGAQIAKGRGLPSVQAAYQLLDVVPASLAAIGVFDVVEHIEDDLAALQNFHRALQPGGMIYATVPAHSWLWSATDVESGHYRRYTLRMLESLFTRVGFEPVFMSYFFAFLIPPIFIFRALPYRLGGQRLGAKGGERERAAEHAPKRGVVQALMERSMRRELQAIGQGRGLRLGASIVIAARKS